MKAAKVKPSVTEGQAAGAWLVERASHVLLTEYNNRKVDSQSEASAKLGAIMERLRSALDSSADPAIGEALHTLDGAVWDLVVEYEDRAWHAAWTAATGLITGATASGMPHVGSGKRRR